MALRSNGICSGEGRPAGGRGLGNKWEELRMSKTELVEAYSRGEISRRVFIRRLIATGISLGAALVYADTVKAQVAPVSATTADFYPPPENTPGKVTAGGYIDPATSNVTNPATIKI